MRGVRKISPKYLYFWWNFGKRGFYLLASGFPHSEVRIRRNCHQPQAVKWHRVTPNITRGRLEQNVCFFKEEKQRKQSLGSECPHFTFQTHPLDEVAPSAGVKAVLFCWWSLSLGRNHLEGKEHFLKGYILIIRWRSPTDSAVWSQRIC